MLCDSPVQSGSQNNLAGHEFQPSKSDGLNFQNGYAVKKKSLGTK